MAASSSRASAFWSEPSMSNYFPDDDLEQQEHLVDSDDDPQDVRTPLDKTIDRIGMGHYQWTLLSLCGFGWMADNMWIQAIAIILPRVQQHYSVSDRFIGSLSSSMFGGMMLGAVGWGTCSDLLGRSTAFNATLFFTSLFGFFASFANSFPTLCVALFFLGSAVGGSMPTDGTLLLEHMPKEKQYLVTALSVFFSFGSVLSAFVALLVLPSNSCPNPGESGGAIEATPCDVMLQNQGWKYLLITLAMITLSMFLARILFFRLHESPRYLVHAGRPQDALESLRLISKFNGSDLELELDDVADHHPHDTPPSPTTLASPHNTANGALDSNGRTLTKTFNGKDAEANENAVGLDADRPTDNMGITTKLSSDSADSNGGVRQYDATGQMPATVLERHSFRAPIEEHPILKDIDKHLEQQQTDSPPAVAVSSSSDQLAYARRLSYPNPTLLSTSRRSSAYSQYDSVHGFGLKRRIRRWMVKFLPRQIRRPLRIWWNRVVMVLEPEWFRTTVLVWVIWFTMSLAFTMFNVYFPKLLEIANQVESAGVKIQQQKSLEENLWDVMIFTLGGTPGAILGAFLVESSLGRRWSLAASTFVTAAFCIVFVTVESTWAVRTSSVGISLSATTMWAVLYGWTPEIFGTKVRGTACGIASALSRIGGMIAPLLGGTLLMFSRAVPVYTSVVVFAIAGFCVLLLKEGEGVSMNRAKGLMH